MKTNEGIKLAVIFILALNLGGCTPNVQIISPADGTAFILGQEITFTGTATDLLTQDLPEDLFSWQIDGVLAGKGKTIKKTDLLAGSHTITLTVIDMHGRNAGISEIIITINGGSTTTTIASSTTTTESSTTTTPAITTISSTTTTESSTTTTLATTTTADSSTTTVAPLCGNGVVDDGEDCDGTDLNGDTCMSQGFAAGTLGCLNCTFDTSECFNSCTEALQYPEAILTDPANDLVIAENDVTELMVRQIADDMLQVKVTVRGNPLDLAPTNISGDTSDNHKLRQYLVCFNSDGLPGDDFRVRMGVEIVDNQTRWFASVESNLEGTMAGLPALVRDHSMYAHVKLTPYRPSYQVGSIIKFWMDSVSIIWSEWDHVPGPGTLILSSGLVSPFSLTATANQIFTSSPNSMYLDYDQRETPVALSIDRTSAWDGCVAGAYFFSTNSTIAEIIDGCATRTNYDTKNEVVLRSSKAIIGGYLPDCDLMVNDTLLTVSGNVLFSGANASFVLPPTMVDPNTQQTINYQQILTQYEAARITSIAVEIQTALTGEVPPDGANRIFAFDYPFPGAYAGQPIFMGWGMIVNGTFPFWDVYYHEMGHTMLTHVFSSQFRGLTRANTSPTCGCASPPCDNCTDDWNRYGEGFASLCGLYSLYKQIAESTTYAIPTATKATLQLTQNNLRNGFVNNNDPGCPGCTSLYRYEHQLNKDFTKLDANIMDGMFFVMAENQPTLNPFGWEIYPRFFKVFRPQFWSQFDPVGDGEGATFLVAALSAAADNDLLPLFRDQWNFPIVQDYYDQIKPILVSIVNGP